MKGSYFRRKRQTLPLKVWVPIPFIILVLVGGAYTLASIYFSWDRLDDRYGGLDFDYDHHIDIKIANQTQAQIQSKRNKKFETDIENYVKDVDNLYQILNLKNPEKFCEHENGYKRLLTIIISAPVNFNARELIRKTYGSLRKYRRWIISNVFFIRIRTKNSTSVSVMRKLQIESDRYGDIVISLPSQNISKIPKLPDYKWAITYCKDADFVLKAIDSVYIDMFQLVEIVTHHHDMENKLLCKSRPSRPVNRKVVSPKHFPDHFFPSYCSPEAIILPHDVIKSLYISTMKSEMTLPMTDTEWTTGFIRRNLGIEIINIGYKYCSKDMYFKYIRWATDGKFGRDQKFQWVVMPLPNLNVKDNVMQLWNKTLIVNRQVYEFEVDPLT